MLVNGKIVQENGNVILPPPLDEEALRLISIMPKWKAGKDKDGNPVKVRMIIPITFKLVP